MTAGGYKYVPCVLKRESASDIRVIHVLGGGEGLQGPVDEAVEEDEAGAAGPDHQDGDEGGAQIIDHLQGRRASSINGSLQRVTAAAPGRYLDAGESDG